MVDVRHLTKAFESCVALADLSCSVEDGSVYGLVGYNGAGKTTLLKTVAGIYRPNEGRVLVDGESVHHSESIRRSLFLVPDEPYFLPQANLDRMAGFYKGYYPTWNDKTYQKLTELFHLDPAARLAGFSKGMQRQASILLALAVQPRLLLLDETFDGLDPVMRSLVKKILLEYLSGEEVSILISSHNLRELEDLCDHVGLMNDRHIVFDSALDEMRQSHNKYRIAFSFPLERENIPPIPMRNLKITGQVVNFSSCCSAEEVEKSFSPLQPVLLESVPMSIEEIFLEEMEVQDYDLSGLF